MNEYVERRTVVHTLAPVFNENSRILILGTMPSPKSRETGFYYNHPQNRFWPVLSAVLQESLPKTNDEKRALLLRRGIALWDVLASCEIAGAGDTSIRNPIPNNLTPVLCAAQIHAVFTTGRKASELYHKFIFPNTEQKAIALPSPSAANAVAGLERLITAYGIINDFLED